MVAGILATILLATVQAFSRTRRSEGGYRIALATRRLANAIRRLGCGVVEIATNKKLTENLQSVFLLLDSLKVYKGKRTIVLFSIWELLSGNLLPLGVVNLGERGVAIVVAMHNGQI